MFGGGFGSRTTSAFGQTSTFGKPTNTFSSPSFGTNTTPLFGQTTQPATTSLFGSTAPTFGQTTTTQSFGSFGANTGSSLFGSQPTTAGTTSGLFGNQNAGGSTPTGSLFGSSGTTTFGSNTGFGTFGSSANTGLFGQTQQPATQSTSLFGQPSSVPTGLFCSPTSAFSAGGTTNGTSIKFVPVTGTDTMLKNGITQTISTKHHCITCMKEYEGKSLEELRYEDYLANRKGPSQNPQSASGLFCGSGQTSLFGTNATTATMSGGSLFGNTGFGQSTVFGQNNSIQPNNSLFGKSSSSPFGATTTTTQSTNFGSFGQGSNIFGSNTNQTKPAFGTPQTSSGLFGSNPAASNFGSQAPGFSFGTQQQNQGIGLFGQQNKFGGFGTQTTSSFTFGSNTSSANTTSLFNQKPATTGFGITPTTSANTFGSSPFGSNAQPGGSLFSGGFNKPQTTGFSFGQNTSNVPTLGNTNLNGGSLFGNTTSKPGGLFGNTNSSIGLFGSSGFGSSCGFNTTSNSGFGGLNFNSGGLNSTFGGSSQSSTGSSVCDQIQVMSVLPYGDSPLYKYLRPTTGKTEDLLKPTVVPQKLNNDNNYKLSTHINNIVTRKAHSSLESSKKSLFDKIEDEINEKTLNQQCSSPRYLKLKPKSFLIKMKNNTKNTTTESSTPTKNTNEENIATQYSSSSGNQHNSNDGNSCLIDNSYASSNCSENEDSPEIKLSDKKAGKSVSFQNEKDVSYQSYDSSNTSQEKLDYVDDNQITEFEKSHACSIKLTRPEYFTVPSLSDLDEIMDEDEHCIVKNFTVGRHKYGNVTFYDAFDVAGLDLDSIVFFRHKEIEIYPNDDVKPPVDTGLNRRAQVTLDRVWPIDKSTREIINDPNRLKQLNFEGKLKRSSVKMNAQFIEYRPLTGSWVFEVEHFSKYGLDDSDDEEPVEQNKKTELPGLFSGKSNFQKKFLNKEKEQTTSIKRGLDGKVVQPITTIAMVHESADEAMALDEESDYFPSSKYPDIDKSEVHSPTEKLARNLDTSFHKVQLMKASFYINESDLDPDISLEKGIPDLDLFATGHVDAYRSSVSNKSIPSLLKTQFTSQFPPPVDIPVTDFAEEEYKPPVYSPPIKTAAPIFHPVIRPQRISIKYRNGVMPTENSIFKNLKMSLCDTGLYFGRHFRVGWSHGFTITGLSSVNNCDSVLENESDQACKFFSGRKSSDYSSNVVQKLQIIACTSKKLKENVENHLEICLKESNFDFEEGHTLVIPKFGTSALHAHCDVEQKTVQIDEDYDRQVWELLVALWGNIPNLDSEYDAKNHKIKMLRKRALSDWLKKVVSSVAENEINESDSVDSIISLLTCGKVVDACKLAIITGDHNLALLISQIGGNEITRSLMEQQLRQWHDSEADQLIDIGRLKIMTLISGHMLFISSKGIVNTCENLDWKRAFALHLWYIARPSDSLIEALLQYEDAFKSGDKLVCSPDPLYTKNKFEYEASSGNKPADLCFHLLKLYSRRSYSLETVLNPVTHTANILDYRLSWLILITLKSLGFNHISEESEFNIHVTFAAQLEIHKLWHWSIFVLLHIKDLSSRLKSVISVIDKNIKLLPDNAIGFTEEEKFVYEKLKIPAEWLYNSKAMLAVALTRYKEAAWYYIKAYRWNEAHEIIFNHLMTTAIINEKYDFLKELFDEIVASECVISGWNYRGAIVFDYLTIVNEINLAISEPSIDAAYFLEKLQPLMSAVCTKVKFFPTTTAKERLCQTEISKRVIQLIRTVLNLQYGKSGISVRFIVSLVDQLPLPEDYKQQELQEIISWWINNT